MSLLRQSGLFNKAVKAAQSVPDLINKLKQVDPEAAQQLTTKPLLTTRTTPFTVLAVVIAWLSGKYGFGWDTDTVNVVTLVVLTVVSYVMRLITTQATSGIVRTPVTVPPNTAPPTN